MQVKGLEENMCQKFNPLDSACLDIGLLRVNVLFLVVDAHTGGQ